MAASSLLQQLLNSVMLGSMYALVAAGFTLYFGMLDLVNFAHGEIFMLGAFTAVSLHLLFDLLGLYIWSPFLAVVLLLVLTIIITSLIGVAMERLAIRPLRQSPLLMGLLATVGISIVLREGVRLFYPRGASPKAFPALVSDRPILVVGETVIRTNAVFVILATAALFVGLHLIITRTRLGAMIRAVAQDKEAATMLGINIDRTVMYTFIIGSALGAMAGILNGTYYHSTKFDVGLLMGVKGFAAAVVGGLGNVYGAILGGFVLGLGETFGSAFVPGGSQNKDLIAFIIVILFLVFRPAGILGKRTHEKV